MSIDERDESLPGSRTTYTLFLLLVGLVLFVAVAEVQTRTAAYVDDDAYIHLRVARNLADYGLPYFNLDEPVSASSSTAWTLCLAVVMSFSQRSIAAVAVFSAIAGVVGTLLVFILFREVLKLRGMTAWCAATIYLATILPTASMGMETSILGLVIVLGLTLVLRRNLWSCVVWGFAPCVRPELIVLSALIVVWTLSAWKGRRTAVVICLLIGAGSWVAYDLIFFNSLVPHAAVAKSRVFDVSATMSFGALMRATVPGLKHPLGLPLWARVGWLAAIGVALVIATVTVWWSGTDRSRVAALCFVGAGTVATLYVVRGVFVAPWYGPVVTIPIILGLFLIIHEQPATIIAVGLLGIPISIAAATTIWGAYDSSHLAWFKTGARVRQYLEIGRQLSVRFPMDAEVLASEIGGLGWTYAGPVRDSVGLASPSALKWHPLRVPEDRSSGDVGAIPPGYVLEVDPDVIVTHPHFAEALLSSDVMTRYRQVAYPVFLQSDGVQMESPGLWGGAHILVLVRK